MKIIAYTYDADFHCPACARADWMAGRLKIGPRHPLEAVGDGGTRPVLDEHGIPEWAEDSEGNPIHPVFSTDEIGDEYCGDCNRGITA